MSEPDRKKAATISAYQITGIAPLASFPISFGDFRELTIRLRPQEKEGLELLFVYVYQHGEALPSDHDELANIAGVGRGRWATMAPRLAPFFIVDDDCWHHPGLQEAHHRYFQIQEDDRLYRERAAVFGATGRAIRKLRQAAKEETQRREAERAARAAEAGELPNGFAETLGSGNGQVRVGLGYPSRSLVENEVDPNVATLGSGVAAHGLTDCPDSAFQEEELSVSPSVSASCEDEATARDPSRTRPMAVVERGHPGRSLADCESGEGRVGHEAPSPTLSGVGSHGAGSSPTDDELADWITEAGGDGLATNWHRRKAIMTTRTEMAKGLDFKLHIAPEISASAKDHAKHGKELLRDPLNKNIIAAASARSLRIGKRVGEPEDDEHVPVYLEDPANAPALAALFAKHPFLKDLKHPPGRDARGPFRKFPRNSWEAAVASAARDAAAVGDRQRARSAGS